MELSSLFFIVMVAWEMQQKFILRISIKNLLIDALPWNFFHSHGATPVLFDPFSFLGPAKFSLFPIFLSSLDSSTRGPFRGPALPKRQPFLCFNEF